MDKDPDTTLIQHECKSLVGKKITIKIQVEGLLKMDGTNCNTIGDYMDDIVYMLLKKKIPSFERGPKQASPDFWNRNRKYEWENKAFKESPCFDIANYTSYIHQLNKPGGVKKKLFRTRYLIFQYSEILGYVQITSFKLCWVWELLSYTGKYPVSLQNKKNMWYNLRPCSFNDIGKGKTPKLFIEKICDSISLCPNKIDDKDNIIKNIKQQFEKSQKSRKKRLI